MYIRLFYTVVIYVQYIGTLHTSRLYMTGVSFQIETHAYYRNRGNIKREWDGKCYEVGENL
jgi:hypothetical protein